MVNKPSDGRDHIVHKAIPTRPYQLYHEVSSRVGELGIWCMLRVSEAIAHVRRNKLEDKAPEWRRGRDERCRAPRWRRES